MKRQLSTLKRNVQSKSGFALIIIIAVLIEIIAGLQYRNFHKIFEEQLEEQTLKELTIKALVVKRILGNAEEKVYNFEWYASAYSEHPDTMFLLVERMVRSGKNIVGAFVAFRPNHFPAKGRLFEPYAQQLNNDSVRVIQVAGKDHDYTQAEFYRTCMRGDTASWTNPYYDKDGYRGMITSYAIPLSDKSGQIIGVLGVDLALDWFGEITNQRHIYPSSYNIFLTENGEYIAGPATDKVPPSCIRQVTDFINDSTSDKRISQNRRTTIIDFRETESNRKASVYYAPMRGKPRWTVALVCYRDEVFKQLHDIRLRIFLFALLGLLLLSYIVWKIFKYHHNLQIISRDQAMLSSELNIAQNIQHQMLPPPNDTTLRRAELDIAGTLVPAKEVGGDIYDYFIRDEKLFFCIGDVSGKGVPSALVMAVVHSMFQMAGQQSSNPAHIIQMINHASCNRNESNMFVTFFLGILDLPSGRLHYCNAGHNPPLLVEGNTATPLPTAANMPLGIIHDFKYRMQESQLAPNAMLVLYTDGITEAMNARHNLFTLARTQEVIELLDNPSAAQTVDAITRAVEQFCNGTTQSDDITLLAVKYTPPSSELYTTRRQLTLDNDLSKIDTLNSFVLDVAKQLNLPQSLARQFQLAVEEVVVNVINYAYPTGEKGTITIDALSDNQTLTFVVTDNGVAFDPTEVPAADTTLSAQDRPIGGLGIMLVRNMMDAINYQRIDRQNVLTLKKHI